MLDLTLVVIAKNNEDMGAFKDTNPNLAGYDGVVNRRRRSLASIANGHLDTSNQAVFGLCHADMVFKDGSLQAFYDCAMTGAVCGACGRSFRYQDAWKWAGGDSSYVWSKDWGRPTVRQLDAGYPANPNGPCPVSTLDSSCIFFRRDLGIRFDEATFDGFHCHGEDICLQAQARGIPVLVPAADAWHACPDVNGPNWGKERDVYYRKLKAKWPQREFTTT